MDNNIENVTNENVTNEENEIAKPKSKILTLSMIGAVILAAGCGYFYMTNNTQTAHVQAPKRTHVHVDQIKGKLKSLGIHFDNNHLKAVNTTNDKTEIYVNENKIILNPKQYVDFEVKPKTGQIFVANKDVKFGFNYELSSKNELLSIKKITFMPEKVGLKDIAVNDVPADAKINAPTASDAKSGDDFCGKSSISDNTDEMRETFKGIAHNLNLGPLEMLLGPAMPRIVQNSQRIKVGSEYINYVTTEDGNGTLGEYLPDILQKDNMQLGTLALNMKKAMSDSNYAKVIINKNTTAIYPSNLDEAKAKKLIGCF